MLMKCYILCNVKNKRRFTHGGTRRDQDQIGRLQASRAVVKIKEAGRDSRNGAGCLGCDFKLFKRIHNDLADRHVITASAACGKQIKHLFFGDIHDCFDTLFSHVALVFDLFI